MSDGAARAERARGPWARAAAAPSLQAVGVQRREASGRWTDTAPRVRAAGAGRAWRPRPRVLRVGGTGRGGRGCGPGPARENPNGRPCALNQATVTETEREDGGKGHWRHVPGGHGACDGRRRSPRTAPLGDADPHADRGCELVGPQRSECWPPRERSGRQLQKTHGHACPAPVTGLTLRGPAAGSSWVGLAPQ